MEPGRPRPGFFAPPDNSSGKVPPTQPGTYTFTFDNMGRLKSTSTQYTFVSGIYANSYSYDATSNRTGYTDPTGATVAYGYDTLNRLSSLTDSVTGQFSFGYDADGRRTSLNRPNSVNTSYSYDSLSRLLSVLHQSGSTTLDGATYTLDDAGNRMSKQNMITSVTDSYTYDNIYQLTQVLQGATTTESYSYDRVGNRTASLGVTSYTVNNSNQLTSTASGTSFTYDDNGNTLTKTDTNGTTTYMWDLENRLVQAQTPANGTVTFKYDPFGRRIQKASAAGGTVNYLYDEANIVEELSSSGTVLAKYTQGLGVDEPLAMNRSGANSYYNADGLGTITSLIDGSGNAVASYTYDAYGKVTASGGSAVNPFRYTGREWDSETGLHYYRGRYYEPETGRFISEDPIRFQGGRNFYGYVNNDPTDLVDPLGLKPGSPQYCSSLLPKIQNIQNRIDKRLGELDEDPGQLPQSCPGDKANPSLSRAGHRMLINMDKALLAARKAEYLAFCGGDPPGVPTATPAPTPKDNYFDRRFWEKTTGLTGGALALYLVVSEGSRLYPPRNLVPVP